MKIAKALVVAGGQWQIPIVKFLLNMKYEVTVVDPYDTSPCVAIAQCHIKMDVRDEIGILNLIRDKKFDLVTTDQSDISVETVAYLAEHLNLPGNTIKSVQKFSNKLLSREYANNIGVPIPAFFKANDIEEVKHIFSSFGCPMIIKPVDSQSSRGIFKIDGNNIADIDSLARQTFNESRERYILVEEFFDGTEYTVEGICSNGKHRTLALSQKKHFRTGIASDLEYPAVLPPKIRSLIVENNDKYVECSGLRFGITHAEYLYNAQSGKICLVEIACRGGGSLISSDVVKWVTGIDLYDIYINDLKGNTTNLKELKLLQRSAILHFFEFTNGRVEKIYGLDEIKHMPGVLTIKMDFKEGDILKAANDDRSRQGYVIIFADNHEELQKKLKHINNVLKVVISNV